MEFNIEFPDDTSFREGRIVLALERLTGKNQLSCKNMMRSTGKVHIIVQPGWKDEFVVEQMHNLKSCGCKVYTIDFVIFDLHELVSAAIELHETAVAQQLEQCIILLKLKHGI